MPAALALALGSGVAGGATSAEATAASGVLTVQADSGTRVVVTFTRGSNSLSKTVTGAGSSPVPVVLSSSDLATLGDGTINVSAVASDAAGQPSATAALSFTLDTTAPSAPILALGSGVAGGATSAEATAASGVVTVQAEIGDRVVVTLTGGGNSLSKTVTGAGSSPVPVVLSSSDLVTLGNGLISVSAVTTDTAGNSPSPLSTVSFTLDTNAPIATLTPATLANTANATVQSSEVGTAYLVRSSVVVNSLASITSAADSLWNQATITTPNVSTNLSLADLQEGIYKLYTVDAAGNLSAAPSDTVTVFDLAPTLNGTPSTALSTITGSGGDGVGETITLTLTFTENVTGLTSGSDSTVFTVGGAGVAATWSGTNGTNTRQLTYKVAVGQNGQAAIDEAALKTALTAGITDASGNAFSYTADGGSIPNIDSTPLPVINTSVISMGSLGRLIAPTTVDGGKIYYYWDRNNNGLDSADEATHDYLDSIFKYDSTFTTVNPNWSGTTGVADTRAGNDTTNTYRFAYYNATTGNFNNGNFSTDAIIRLALPTYGSTVDGNGRATPPSGMNQYQSGTSVSGNTNNPTYDDMLAVWDGNNGTAVGNSGGAGLNGLPPGWTNNWYWSATPTSNSTHAIVIFATGNVVNTGVNAGGAYVALQVLPIVIDLNRDGMLDYGSVVMDVNGDGSLDQTKWAGARDGVLVWDKYQDGLVHDHSQYAFAQYDTSSAGLGKTATDLSGLADAFDSNHDGVFDARDAQFGEFRVWQDANQNGVSDAGEVKTLAELGLASFKLSSDGVARTPAAGVHEAGRTSATAVDGSQVLVADVAFEFSPLVQVGAGDLGQAGPPDSLAALSGALAGADAQGGGYGAARLWSSPLGPVWVDPHSPTSVL